MNIPHQMSGGMRQVQSTRHQAAGFIQDAPSGRTSVHKKSLNFLSMQRDTLQPAFLFKI